MTENHFLLFGYLGTTMNLLPWLVLIATPLILATGTSRLLRSMLDKEQGVCQHLDGSPYTVSLLNTIAKRYFKLHTTVIMYDDYFFYHSRIKVILEKVLRTYAYPFRHGRINTTMAKPGVPNGLINARQNEQMAFIIFSKEPEIGAESINLYHDLALRDVSNAGSLAILITHSSIFNVKVFLRTKLAADIVNLLVLVDPTVKVDVFTKKKVLTDKECDVQIFSHDLVRDTLGTPEPVIVTAWRRDHYTRQVPLFKRKFKKGLGGRHLIVSAAEIPPFVFKTREQSLTEENPIELWEGIEVRLMNIVGSMMNFSVEFKEPELNVAEDVAQVIVKEVQAKKANLAVGGVYLTPERIEGLVFSLPHTQDCASFISLASTALPKYRAIMGPFLWDTWLALTAVYILAMFPIAFSVWHSIKPLISDIKEIENMFWYVFGTFTNCFTFTGENSWSKSNMIATKLFIGTYWVFTIIITACYTGSIVAFITLPVFPTTIDTSKQLLEEKFKISLLQSGGWKQLFEASEDPIALKLYKSVDLVPDLFSGLKNVTKNVHKRRQSAFLGSRRYLEYVVRTNFTPSEESKRLLFHLSDECFVPLLVSFVLERQSPFLEELNSALARTLQYGYMEKVTRDVDWEVYRSASGKLLRAHRGLKGMPEDRELTLDDTQGMFLLLGAGFAIATFSLAIEIVMWARHEMLNREFGDPTLWERALDKLWQHWDAVYKCLLAPPEKSAPIYMRARRVSSAFGEYTTHPYSPWLDRMSSPTVEPPSPSNRDSIREQTSILVDSLSLDHLRVPPERPIRMMSF